MSRIEKLLERINRYLLIGAGDTTDEAVEGNHIAEEARAVLMESMDAISGARKVMHDLADARREVERLKGDMRSILARHDGGKCTCGGCCIARAALTGKRGDDLTQTATPAAPQDGNDRSKR